MKTNFQEAWREYSNTRPKGVYHINRVYLSDEFLLSWTKLIENACEGTNILIIEDPASDQLTQPPGFVSYGVLVCFSDEMIALESIGPGDWPAFVIAHYYSTEQTMRLVRKIKHVFDDYGMEWEQVIPKS